MMNDDMLSQDEIDALLRGTDENDDIPQLDEVLSPLERDALGEVGNISFGSSATALSVLLNQKVEITTPSVSIIQRKNIDSEFPQPYVAIQVNYTDGFLGTNLLVIKQEDAAIIADLMLGGDGTNTAGELGEIQLSAVQEAMNQMMGSAATSMSTIFGKRVDISPPTVHLLDIKEKKGIEYLPDEDILIKVSFRLKIGDLIDSNIMQLLPIDFAKELVQQLLHSNGETNSSNSAAEAGKETAAQEAAVSQPSVTAETIGAQPSYEPSKTAAHETTNRFGANARAGERQIQSVDFAEFEPSPSVDTEVKNLSLLLDVPLQVTVELGRTKRSVQEILHLSSGSIIELDKLAGEPVDILVNNKLIAKGEVVVIDENFGVRVTDIISQSDRLKRLK
ncbi:flagellar motor switch phosphatase FliY [Parageobacillus thermoglucosidasius]|uniref:Flagellar motor switch phosphatase FliY n=1 Tax=Parageobacillus thermoglucosidasius TaxID=1426 RepID=A0A1B7KTF2_PARTM|nr:flagellar motor switch phosphatase FliY [Parageobacillus thermoglucosidasius]OAT73362.1 flagellar motor switch phosphatase FliY [Parageobacillus thermoglucosidasius]